MQAPKQRQGRRRRGAGPGDRSNSLTGGSGDVKPEFMSGTSAQAVADTALSTAYPLPVLRNFSSGNGSKAQIIEILKVGVMYSITPTAVYQTIAAAFGTKNNAATAIGLATPDVFAFFKVQSSFTAAGTSAPQEVVHWQDLTDGAGNGILVATDNIYVQVSSAATGVANSIGWKILYRVYGASVMEYVGIVQGQQ